MPSEDSGHALLAELLSKNPTENLFLLSRLEELRRGRSLDPAEFFALPEAGPLSALVLISERGLWVPVASDLKAAFELGEGLRDRPLLTTVGERAAVDALWRGYSKGRNVPTPRMARAQRLLEITPDEMGPWVTPHVRLAREDELPQVVEASAAMQLADLGCDPRTVDAAAHESRCLGRIRDGQTFVIFDGARLVFKADIGSRCKFGAQVEGVYTAPEHRCRGVATLALGQICRTLLSALPRLTLHADPVNRAAHGLYRKIGFGDRAEFRLLIAE